MDRFEGFCVQIQKMISDEKTLTRKIENGRALVSELTSRQDWFFNYLKKMLVEPAAFENQNSGIWPNELTLYRSPDRSFLVLAYIWDAHLADIIHDHSSWGIIGTLLGRLRENEVRADRRRETGGLRGAARDGAQGGWTGSDDLRPAPRQCAPRHGQPHRRLPLAHRS